MLYLSPFNLSSNLLEFFPPIASLRVCFLPFVTLGTTKSPKSILAIPKETSETREETRSTRVFGISANPFTLPLIYVIR